MKHPEKWRDGVNPFNLPFKKFKLIEVLGYPHARNDVFHVKGIYNESDVEAYIKVARQKDSDLKTEIDTILKLNSEFTPKIIDCDDDKERFVVTLANEGERLSYLLSENPNEKSTDYLFEYGQTLAKMHGRKGDFSNVKDRKFFHVPEKEFFDEYELQFVYEFLSVNRPKTVNECFCHGDFHYANVLWKGGRLSVVLDFELSGRGNREFDIAWAIIRRPGQRFLIKKEEGELFLKGYSSLESYDLDSLKYYMALVYSYFYEIGKNDEEYKAYVIKALKELCKN